MSDVAFSFDRPSHNLNLDAIQTAIAAEAPPDPTPVVTPETHEAPTPPVEAKVEVPTEPPVEAKAPEAELKTHKITVDGQELEVTEADLKAGHMRQRDYTKKTQELAAERKAIEAERQQWAQKQQEIADELGRIDAFLRNQEAIDRYYEEAFGRKRGQPITAPSLDPNSPITAAQAAEIARYNAEQSRLMTERQLAEVRAEALKAQQQVAEREKAAQREKAGSELNSHVNSLLDKYPVLKRFDAIDEELFGDASRFQPKSLDEAKQRLTEAAERKVATIRAIAEEEKKAVAVRAAELKNKGTEAPGGAPPKAPEPRKLTLDTKDRKDFLKAAEDDLRAILNQGR